jgi:hypothetical protein
MLREKPGSCPAREAISETEELDRWNRIAMHMRPATDTEAAKTAPVVSTYTFPGPNPVSLGIIRVTFDGKGGAYKSAAASASVAAT